MQGVIFLYSNFGSAAGCHDLSLILLIYVGVGFTKRDSPLFYTFNTIWFLNFGGHYRILDWIDLQSRFTLIVDPYSTFLRPISNLLYTRSQICCGLLDPHIAELSTGHLLSLGYWGFCDTSGLYSVPYGSEKAYLTVKRNNSFHAGAPPDSSRVEEVVWVEQEATLVGHPNQEWIGKFWWPHLGKI
jgi:hypothetical protein